MSRLLRILYRLSVVIKPARIPLLSPALRHGFRESLPPTFLQYMLIILLDTRERIRYYHP